MTKLYNPNLIVRLSEVVGLQQIRKVCMEWLCMLGESETYFLFTLVNMEKEKEKYLNADKDKNCLNL